MLIGFCLVACKPPPGTAESSDPTGTYTLITIDGHELPYAPSHEGEQGPEIVASTFTINADGTFLMKMNYKAGSRSSSRDFTGTYTFENSTFRFEWDNAGVTSATLEGNTFTMNNEGILFAYRK
jgi:hypothetical protein